jgi:carbon-monoxide dehydrogenase large subunit
MKFGIGQAVTRREDDRLLTGTGQFVDDLDLPGAAHAVFVRSVDAHGRLLGVDTSAASAVPGVLAVLTGADLLADDIAPFPGNPSLKNAAGKPMSGPPFHALATDAVRFVGQPVAAVIAETRGAAEQAAAQVFADVEPMPAAITLGQALAPDAPILWNESPGNVGAVAQYGDAAACDAAFGAAAHVVNLTVDNQRLAPVTLEPRACAAEFDAVSGRLTLHASSQSPSGKQKLLAEMLKLPPETVRVRVGDVGGGFGMKAMLYAEDVVCAYAARKLRRTVRWRAARNEDFQAAGHGRDQLADAALAVDRDGRVLALRVRITGNIGAYAYGPAAIINIGLAPKVITGVYHVPALDVRGQAVLTNTNIVAAYRGAGRPEAIYLIERLMDLAAIAAGLSQVEIRRRNLIQPAAMPYRTPMGETFDSGNFPLILDRVLRAADWDGYAQRKAASEARGLLRGRALSTFLEWTGVVHQETVHLKVEDGRVRVYTAMQAMGQGIETSYLQILAETLDVDAERIEIVQGDSDIAQGIGSMGSRSLYIGGSAMFTASQQTIDAGRRLAGAALEAAPEDIQYRAGRFSVAGTDLGIDLFELAARQPDRRIAVDTLQKVGGPSWPNGAHVCELEVDPETGTTQVVRYTTVDDVGRVINPPIVAGQVQGGIAQALGQALFERVHYDADSGQLLSGSLMDYALPRAEDLPMIDTHTEESIPCRINPLGAKGVGELGTVGGTPTIINALLDALRPHGVTDIAMPATPERVWRALLAARA